MEIKISHRSNEQPLLGIPRKRNYAFFKRVNVYIAV